MTLLALLARLIAVVVAMIAVTAVLVVGPARLRRLRMDAPGRVRTVIPALAVLAGVLAINSVVRRVLPQMSRLVGLDITDAIYGLEGGFVAWVQSFVAPPLTLSLSFAYVYGYVFLLVFPLVAYLALADPAPLRETALAYTLNYAIGLVPYLLFVVYGPRQYMPEMVEPLLYASWPESQLLTTQVNSEVNAFPSLHTSLSVTVALLAYRTRKIYPGWFHLAAGLAASVVISTMYLGIHWATDVVAGALLGVVSVAVATRLVRSNAIRRWHRRLAAGPLGRLSTVLRRRFGVRDLGRRLRGSRECDRRDPEDGSER